MLQRRVLAVLAVVVLGHATVSAQQPAGGAAAKPVLLMDTVKGSIEIELAPADAPKSVARILELVKTNFYRGQRVFWGPAGTVQFGDPSTRNMQRLDMWGFGGSGRRLGVAEISKKPIVRGMVAITYPKDRTPADADSMMFIVRQTNPDLNGKYTVVGRVTKGLEVVDKLAMADVIKNITLKP